MTLPSDVPRLGIRLHGGIDPRRGAALAAHAEAHGFESVWLAENPLERGVFPLASACVLATQRIRVGIGIVNPYMRHPAQIAMEFAALDELAQGRTVLGIGSGIGAQIERLGYRYRPLAAMDDAIHIVRTLLRGETIHHAGTVFSADNVALRFRPPRPAMPIYMAAMGDRSLALCGRIADGLIVSNMCPPAYTRRAAGIVREAAQRAGRPMPAVVQDVPALPARTARRHARPPKPRSVPCSPASGRWTTIGRRCAKPSCGTAGFRRWRWWRRWPVCAVARPRKRCWTIGSSTPSPLPAPRRIASLPQRNTVARASTNWH